MSDSTTVKRETLTSGIRGFRWPIAAFVVLMLLAVLDSALLQGYFNLPAFLLMLIGAGLFVMLTNSREMQYDAENLYLLFGAREKVIPMTSIVSIKRSSMKVQGSRPWILEYTNEREEKRKFRFFEPVFGDSTDFRKKVRVAHPSVVIWEHPHFNH